MAELLPPDLCARLDSLDVFSRKVFAGKLQGERRSKRRGRSVEFEEHREYVPGDDLRHIDWNVFARLDRFFIKLFQEEEDLGLELVLDVSPSMNAGTPSKLIFACRLALALGYIGLIRNNRVSLTLLGAAAAPGAGPAGASRGKRLPPVRGRQSVERLGRFLLEHAFVSAANGGPNDEGGTGALPTGAFTATCRGVASARQGKGIVVLISDLLIPPADAAQEAKARGVSVGRAEAGAGYEQGIKLLAAPTALGSAFDVYCVQVLSPGEIDPEREGRGAGSDEASGSLDSSTPAIIGDLALMDVETGRVSEITVTAEVLAAYRAAARAYIDRAAAFCAARSVSHLMVPSDADVGAVVLESLRRRGMLR